MVPDAEKAEPADPNAMALATVDAEGMPDVRMVLLKSFDHDGLRLLLQSESAKGLELAAQSARGTCASTGRASRVRFASAVP